MNEFAKPAVPTWYWVAAIIALLWSIMGCASYVREMTLTAEQIAALPQAQRELNAWQPGWLKGVFAIAVWSGLAGAVALLLRKAWAVPAFTISVIGIVILFGYVFAASGIFQKMSVVEAAGFPIFIFLAGLAMLYFARSSRAKGWLN